MDLITTLGLGPREHMAIVGAGGKTSLMFALAEDLFIGGKRVVIGTVIVLLSITMGPGGFGRCIRQSARLPLLSVCCST